MHKQFFRASLLVFVMSFGLVTNAVAAITQYNSKAAWDSAVAAAGLEGTAVQDFNHYLADKSFRNSQVDIGFGQISQEGVDQGGSNTIRAFPGPNGTPHISMFVEGDDPTTVRLRFSRPREAFGAEVWSALTGEKLAIDVMDDSDVVVFTLLPSSNNGFVGFVADAGELIKTLIFRTQTSDGMPGAGELLDMDNLIVSGLNCPLVSQSCLPLANAKFVANTVKGIFKYQASGEVPNMGNPAVQDDQEICVYDGNGDLILNLPVVAGGVAENGKPHWRGKEGNFKYINGSTNRAGVSKVLIRPDKKVLVKANGENLNFLGDFVFPISVEHNKSNGGACTVGYFPEGNDNGAGKIKAKK